MRKFNLEVVRGDTIPLLVTVVRDGSAMNIAGCSFRAAGKQWLSDTSVLMETEDYEIQDAAGGTVVVTYPPEATEGFTDTITVNTDVEMIEPSGRKTTVARGVLNILADVAR